MISKEWINIGRIVEFPASAAKDSTLQSILERLSGKISISSRITGTTETFYGSLNWRDTN